MFIARFIPHTQDCGEPFQFITDTVEKAEAALNDKLGTTIEFTPALIIGPQYVGETKFYAPSSDATGTRRRGYVDDIGRVTIQPIEIV